MSHRAAIKISSAFVVISITVLLIGYSFNRDPFFAYKDFEKKPLELQEKKLKYFAEEEQLIREKFKLDISEREKAILAGIHFITIYADDDKHFAFLFVDLLLLMNVLSRSGDRIHQGEVARAIIRKSFARAEKNLEKIFNTDEPSRWGFLGIFYILDNYPEFKENYIAFYHRHFAATLGLSFQDQGISFAQAMKEQNYRTLFNFLVQTSFLHNYLVRSPDENIITPTDKFPEYLKQFEQFEYVDHADPNKFRDLGYLVSHVPWVLTNYGGFPLEDSINTRKAQDYIESSFERVRSELGDFDLFAEYVQCLKIFNPGKDPRVKELEKFILSLQRPDGSWGSNRDFSTNPYTAIHPSGAALMALNQP